MQTPGQPKRKRENCAVAAVSDRRDLAKSARPDLLTRHSAVGDRRYSKRSKPRVVKLKVKYLAQIRPFPPRLH